MSIKLIADSGSTKTDWILIRDGKTVAEFKSAGINPVIMSSPPCPPMGGIQIGGKGLDTSEVTEVYFYGAGCVSPYSEKVSAALRAAFPSARVSVESDLLGAARALLGTSEGLACILGTGSNSCLFDGRRIVHRVPPLGYVLGDEGSGAALGRMLLGGVLKGWLPSDVCQLFREEVGLTEADVLQRVYRGEMPSRFLASVVPFVAKHADIEALNHLITRNFEDFFKHNIQVYRRPDLPISFVGGVASVFSSQLIEVASREGYTVGRILQRPIEGLVEFHSRPK